MVVGRFACYDRETIAQMITIWTGIVGSGKSYSLVHELRRRFRAEVPQVFTDMASLKVPHAVYLSPGDSSALAKVSRGIVVLDETQVLYSSRFWQSTDKSVLSAIAQSRKNGLDLFCTTQAMERLDPALREVCGVEIRCRRIGPFVLQLHYPAGVPKVKPFKRSLVRLRADVFRAYDTLEIIGNRVGVGLGRSDDLDALRRRRSRRRGAVKEVVRDDGQRSMYYTSPMAEGREWYLRPAFAAARRTFVQLHGRGPSSEELQLWARRSDWMRWWGLKLDDLPLDCTPDDWWCPGLGPSDGEAIEMPGSEVTRAVREA